MRKPWRDQVGTIKPGARADLSVFRLDEAAGPWVHPDAHPVHVLVHRATRQHLAACVVDGRVVWQRERGAVLVDKEEAAARLRSYFDELAIREAPGAAGPACTRTAAAAERVRRYYRTW